MAARLSGAVAWVALLFTVTGAHAMMAPEEYRAARKKRSERSPPGDEFRIDAEDLVAGRYLEAFAEAQGPRFAVVARQVELIAKPAEKPTFTGKE